MKKSILIAGIAALTIVACKKEGADTMSNKDSIANAEVDTANMAMDTLNKKLDSAAGVTENAVKDAATATTEKGAEMAKDATKGANEAVEKTAEKAKDAAADAKEAVKKATK